VARRQSIGIQSQLTSLISTREINQYARWSGVVKRRRKVEPAALFWAVVLGFSAGGKRSLAGMRRAYEKTTGTRLVPSVFYDRFTKPLAEFFRTVVGVLLEKVEKGTPSLTVAPLNPLAQNNLALTGQQGFLAERLEVQPFQFSKMLAGGLRLPGLVRTRARLSAFQPCRVLHINGLVVDALIQQGVFVLHLVHHLVRFGHTILFHSYGHANTLRCLMR